MEKSKGRFNLNTRKIADSQVIFLNIFRKPNRTHKKKEKTKHLKNYVLKS